MRHTKTSSPGKGFADIGGVINKNGGIAACRIACNRPYISRYVGAEPSQEEPKRLIAKALAFARCRLYVVRFPPDFDLFSPLRLLFAA